MTEKLFQKDSYLKEFTAKVVERNNDEIVLDRTAFYVESGGQPADHGKIISNGQEYNVINATKRGGDIVHKLDRAYEGGDEVKGIIDWNRRYTFMKYHTALHVMNEIMLKKYNAIVTGGQIELEKARLDFAMESLSQEMAREVEEETRKAIEKGLAVKIKFLPPEEAMKIPTLIRTRDRLPPMSGEVRIVELEGFGIQACGGTHLKNTNEIKSFRVSGIRSKGKDNKRMEIFVE